MPSKTKLHKQLDAEFSRYVKLAARNPVDLWSALYLFEIWKDEKEHIDKFGCRRPRITNVSVPRSV